MNNIDIVERLISIKNNALERSRQEAKGNPFLQTEIREYILRNGIEQLVMEIQNGMYVHYRMVKNVPNCQLHMISDPDMDTQDSCSCQDLVRQTG